MKTLFKNRSGMFNHFQGAKEEVVGGLHSYFLWSWEWGSPLQEHLRRKLDETYTSDLSEPPLL